MLIYFNSLIWINWAYLLPGSQGLLMTNIRECFPPNGGYCVHLPSNIFATCGESVYEQFSVYFVGCSLFRVRWYNCINTKTCPFFCSNHKTLSNLELNLKRRLLLWWTFKVWKSMKITWGIFTDILQSSWWIFVPVMQLDQSRARAKKFYGLYPKISIFYQLTKSVAIDTFFPSVHSSSSFRWSQSPSSSSSSSSSSLSSSSSS